MNGGADLGGMMGFGPVDPEEGEPAFHTDWERRVFAVTLAMGFTGSWNLDQSRFARESLPPAEYLTSSYYKIWLAGLEKLLAERELITTTEFMSGNAASTVKAVSRTLASYQVSDTLAKGSSVSRSVDTTALFAVGAAVIAKNMNPVGHTRLPRYLRSRKGTIRAVHGTHVFPDSNAAGHGENPQWLYSVEFGARELWGLDANPNDTVVVDCWEPYLEAA